MFIHDAHLVQGSKGYPIKMYGGGPEKIWKYVGGGVKKLYKTLYGKCRTMHHSIYVYGEKN